MTPISTATSDRPSAPPHAAPPVTENKPLISPPGGISAAVGVRLLLSALVIMLYYLYQKSIIQWLDRSWTAWTQLYASPNTISALLMAAFIASMVALWWKILQRDKRFHAPLLVTSVLLLGEAGYSILENHASPLLSWLTFGVVTKYSPTFVTIVVTMIAEMLLGRYFWGKWPHLASAYVSGISAGILIKSPELWPFLFCGLLSITSKYVLRIGDRHLWNPTNFGVTAMLFLAPALVAPLSVQAGNEVWAVLTIWILGAMILYQIGKVHIPIAFLLAFIPLSMVRAWWTDHAVLTELAPITSPMFQLYIFFMITDPKTITKSKWSQMLVVVLVAFVETFLRLVYRDVHSLFHALFIVGPLANLVEIIYFARVARKKVAC